MLHELAEYSGCVKVKRIMTKTTWVCKVCGLSHEHKNAANGCCSDIKAKLNKEKKHYVHT